MLGWGHDVLTVVVVGGVCVCVCVHEIERPCFASLRSLERGGGGSIGAFWEFSTKEMRYKELQAE